MEPSRKSTMFHTGDLVRITRLARRGSAVNSSRRMRTQTCFWTATKRSGDGAERAFEPLCWGFRFKVVPQCLSRSESQSTNRSGRRGHPRPRWIQGVSWLLHRRDAGSQVSGYLLWSSGKSFKEKVLVKLYFQSKQTKHLFVLTLSTIYQQANCGICYNITARFGFLSYTDSFIWVFCVVGRPTQLHCALKCDLNQDWMLAVW